jgi:hypothetical protein
MGTVRAVTVRTIEPWDAAHARRAIPGHVRQGLDGGESGPEFTPGAFLHAVCGFACLSRFQPDECRSTAQDLLARANAAETNTVLVEGAPADPGVSVGLGACGWRSFDHWKGRLP